MSVFSNGIYHDNEYARYHGHFKIPWIIIYKWFRFLECILRIIFPSTGHNAQHHCMLRQKTRAHSDVNKHGRNAWWNAWRKKRTFTLWQQMAMNSRNAAVTPETKQLLLSKTYLNDLNSHSDFCICYSVLHSTKYLNIQTFCTFNLDYNMP